MLFAAAGRAVDHIIDAATHYNIDADALAHAANAATQAAVHDVFEAAKPVLEPMLELVAPLAANPALADLAASLPTPAAAAAAAAADFADLHVASATTATGVAVVLLGGWLANGPDSVYPENKFNPDSARAYFVRRPLEVVARALEIGGRSAGFCVGLLADYLGGELETAADARAIELAELLTALGPTFIKAGQSASIRTDLLPPAYIRGLTSLQDQVPAFATDDARAIIEDELGGTPGAAALVRSLGDTPVAAASLGQVYRGRLEDGTEVALKVQRPGIVRTIALDMVLIRDVVAPLASAFGLPGDLVATAEEWGRGFVNELDYAAEAANGEAFTASLRGSALESAVFAPAVVDWASCGRVLTTEWVDGERLDRCSAPDDVPRLCSLAMNTYLEMMLGEGTLHCDPHPGNLLRTTDGRLCILDWGLVASIKPELRYTLIEHVAHLTAEDYAKVPGDLVKLGFVPEGGEEIVRANGVADYLTRVYSTWYSGGGASKLDVPALIEEVRQLAAGSEAGIFQIPPYFAYIAKSFSVLEGIGLTTDPEYSIVKETLPYISRRIITDPSPRTAGALETFIFGEAKDDVHTRVLDADRLETLLDGAVRYAAVSVAPPAEGSGAGGDGGATATPRSNEAILADEAASAVIDLLRVPSPARQLALEQLAVIVSAASREAWTSLRSASGRPGIAGGDRSVLGTLVDPLGLFRSSPLVVNDERDHAALAAARKILELSSQLVLSEDEPAARDQLPSSQAAASLSATAAPGGAAATGASQALARVSDPATRDFAVALVRKAWTHREELPEVGRLFALALLDQATGRLKIR